MKQDKLQKILDFTKSEVWEHIKELFKEKEKKVLDFMKTLDLDEESDRKTYKKMQDSLRAFDSLILELEGMSSIDAKNKEIERLNKEIEEQLIPSDDTDANKSIDNKS